MSQATNVCRQAAALPSLESVTRPCLTTAEAAYYLNRKPQTLRIWSLRGSPLNPLRVNGRLAWRTDDIRRMLGIGVAA
jgi:hypothetical protein